ncbi:MAG: class I SAM-dependent methyltransferase [Candidatus Hydrogenedentes bacterium]|nr:class I SAM-dependent methyltransferase [Candidatus Hydrogenedentota bacterium]
MNQLSRDTKLPEGQAEDIRRFKRRYWTQAGIGKEYQYVAYQADPITRSKNVIEIRLVLANILGPHVLDAGAGTGRFAWPLERAGHKVVSLDISREMLEQGTALARKRSLTFRAVRGDIERLPFEDGVFDSVVSITVLRHFPNWREILREYGRVVRPGGRILFDMGSGEQRAYLEKAGALTDANTNGPIDPLSFDIGVTRRELVECAKDLGLRLRNDSPYDFFNSNPLVERMCGIPKEELKVRLIGILNKTGAVHLYELITRRFLSVLSPVLCPSRFIVLENRPTSIERDEFPANCETPSLESREWLDLVLRQVSGADFDEVCAEVDLLRNDPEAEALYRFCETELFPKIPVEAFTWRTD